MSTSDFLREHAIKQIMEQIRAEHEAKSLPVPSDHQLRFLAEDKHDKNPREFRK